MADLMLVSFLPFAYQTIHFLGRTMEKASACPRTLGFPPHNGEPEVTALFQAHTILQGLCNFL